MPKMSPKSSYRLAWCTDIHLNFLPKVVGPRGFGEHILEDFDCDGVVVTGDLSECDQLSDHMQLFWEGMRKKRDLFFVLGNHDYYRGSFAEAEGIARVLNNMGMKWLTMNDPIPLTERTCIVGQEGFYDALCGAREMSRLLMNDFFLIQDFEPESPHVMNLDPKHRFGVMRRKSMMEADAAHKKLTAAAKKYKKVIFATHYPPFEEACFHNGQMSDDNWRPYFTSVRMGEIIMDVAQRFPKTEFSVLCGHTHSPGVYMPRGNVVVRTGASEYRVPVVHEVFNIS